MVKRSNTLRMLCSYIHTYIHTYFIFLYKYVITYCFTINHETFCTIIYRWIQNYSERICLTLNLPTTTIVARPSNASKWQVGFNSAFKG